MDEARFFTTDACRAAGIDRPTLMNWISREPPAILLTAGDRASHLSGRPHLLTFRRVVQIAIVAKLVELRWAPRAAAIAAVKFTDSGNSKRPPLELFVDDRTLLAAHPEAPEQADVIRSAEFPRWIAKMGPRAGLATVVDLTAIVENVKAALA